MPISKETQSEVFIKKPIWWRALVWSFLGLAMMFFIAGLVQSLTEVDPAYLIMAGIGLLFTLLGISFVRMHTKVNFNKPPGYMTVVRGNYPSFLRSLRTRVISREEAKSVFVYPVQSTGTNMLGTVYTHIFSYRVNVVMLSGKEVTLYDERRADVANHLAKRILGWAIGDSEASRQKLDRSRLVKSSPGAKFSMRVEGAFQATFTSGALGMVVGGTVEQGTIRNGDEVEVRGYRSTKRAKVFEVDTPMGSAAQGERIQLLIEDLTEDDVRWGDIVERV